MRSCAPTRRIWNCRRSPASSRQAAARRRRSGFAPPGLSAATGQAIGTGDGQTTVFPLVRSIGPTAEPVAGNVGRLGGLSQRRRAGAGWTVSSGYAPAITFATAPGAGVAITADFGVLWLCRFAEDVQDFEEFMTHAL